MVKVIGATFVGLAAAGGKLALTWEDCGDASTHGKTDTVEPSEIVIGQDTTIVGSGSTDKEISSGSFTMKLSASMGIKDTYDGKICEAKEFKMPLNIGTVSWAGMDCPVVVGPSTVKIGVHMASILPAALAKADLALVALDQDGEQAVCVNTHLKKEESAEALKSCTGADDPAVTEARCYHGHGGALGLTENVDVKIVDYASGKGHINVAGDGIESFTCDNKVFSKSGQAITTDLSDCQPSGISIPAIAYCSDQDTIKVTVKDDVVPLPISAQLERVDCASREAAASCSGDADPDVSSPRCYHGSGGALGLTENVDVKISDLSGGAGHIDVTGDGIEAFTCSNKAFTKSGQAISTDLSDCAPKGITISAVNYCSDQDTVKVTVKDDTVPLPISATLKKVACASAVEV